MCGAAHRRASAGSLDDRGTRSFGSVRIDPIWMVPYDPVWARSFADQAGVVSGVLAEHLFAPVEHIGSTAVPGLCAKSIIDMLAVVDDTDAVREHDWHCYRFGKADFIARITAEEIGTLEGSSAPQCAVGASPDSAVCRCARGCGP